MVPTISCRLNLRFSLQLIGISALESSIITLMSSRVKVADHEYEMPILAMISLPLLKAFPLKISFFIKGGFILLRNMFGTERRTPVALRRRKLTMPEDIRHLRMKDRKIISRMMKDNKPQTEIATTIGFSQGTIRKELNRNSGKQGYRPKQAQAKALERKHSKPAR